MSQSDWICEACNGPLVSLGVLGRTEHARCRLCNLDHNRPAPLDPEDQLLRDEEEAGLTDEELAAGQAGFDAQFGPPDNSLSYRLKLLAEHEAWLEDQAARAPLVADEDERFANDMKPRG